MKIYLFKNTRMIYISFQTAVMEDSYEKQLAILRNALVNHSTNYTSPLEVLSAVKRGAVTVGLIDAVTAAGYENEIAEMGLRVYDIIDTNSGFGVVLSSGMEYAENDFRSFVITNKALIDLFLKQKIPVLMVRYEFFFVSCYSID